MVRTNRPRRAGEGPTLAFGAALTLWVLLVSLPSVGAEPDPTPMSFSAGPLPPTVQGALSFNGVDVRGHGTPGTAITSAASSPGYFDFAWTAVGGKFGTPAFVAVAAARVQVEYLGVIVSTQSAVESPPIVGSAGSANVTADASWAQYLTEGVYYLTGQLVGPNGTTIWSEGFFVHVEAQYHVTLANAGLASAAGWQLFAVLRARVWGPHA
jgi:hypothetical protein